MEVDARRFQDKATIGGSHVFLDRGRFVYAKGSWGPATRDDDRPDARRNVVNISCDLDAGRCDENDAQITSSGLLTVDEETFWIERADPIEIVSKPTDYPCARWTLHINRHTKEVTKHRRDIPGKGCSSFNDGKDWRLRLVDPQELQQQLWEEEWALPDVLNLAPEARDRLEPTDTRLR